MTNQPEPSFYKLASKLKTEYDPDVVRGIFNSFFSLENTISKEVETYSKAPEVDAVTLIKERSMDIYITMELLNNEKKKLQDPKSMNVLDFKKHMNFGRAIKQLSSLKELLERVEQIES